MILFDTILNHMLKLLLYNQNIKIEVLNEEV